MIAEKLRNYDAAQQKHKVEAFLTPHNFDDLPTYEKNASVPEREELPRAGSNQSNDESQAGRDSPRLDDDDATTCLEPSKQRTPRGTVPLAVHCGEMPEGSSLDQFHAPPSKVHSRNAEGRY